MDFAGIHDYGLSGHPVFPRLRMCSEIYHTLKKVLNEGGYSTAVGDEGGFAPNLKNAEEVLETIVKAVEKSGYHPGYDIKSPSTPHPASFTMRPADCTCSRVRLRNERRPGGYGARPGRWWTIIRD